MCSRSVIWLINPLFILIFYGCGGGSPDTSTNISFHDPGGLALHVKFKDKEPVNPPRLSNKVRFDCTGINEIAVQIYNEKDILIAGNPTPWSCSQESGTIENIPAGSNYTVVFMAKDMDDEIVYYGQDIVDILPGQVTQSEIVATAFEPRLQSPDDEAEASSIKCVWRCIDDLDDVVQYELRLSQDNEMEEYISVVTEHCELKPQNIAANMVYYWQVAALDRYGNQRLANEIRSFTATLGSPRINSPLNGDIIAPGTVEFSWSGPEDGRFRLMLSNHKDLSEPFDIPDVQSATSYIYSGLQSNATYYWQVSQSQTNARFGWSADIGDDYAIVGAYNEDGGTGGTLENAGAVYIYHRTAAGQWDDGFRITSPSPFSNSGFGCSVAIDDDLAVVGSYENGRAYVYYRSGLNTWSLGQPADHEYIVTNRQFCAAVAISGDRVVVGQPDKNEVAIFEYFDPDPNNYNGAAIIMPEDIPGADQGWYGQSVALSGDYVAVGAPMNGSVYIYKWAARGTWPQDIKLTSPSNTIDFGHSIEMDGPFLIVGASENISNFVGNAYVYQRTDNGWDNGFELIPMDPQDSSQFGFSVALSGDYAIVGAQTQRPEIGAVYLFHRTSENLWSYWKKLTASQKIGYARFGSSVAINGDSIIVGARGEDYGDPLFFEDAGGAYIY